jgi:hypothetical protein
VKASCAEEAQQRFGLPLVVRLGASRFGARKHLLRRNQEVDVVEIIDLGRIHNPESRLTSKSVKPYRIDEHRSSTA